MGGTVGRDNSDMTFLGNLRDKLRSRRKSTHRRTGTGILAGSSSQASDTPSSGVTDGPGGPVKLSREGHQLASPVVPPVDLEPIEASRVNNGTARADADTQAPITDSVASTTRSEGTQATDVPSPAAPPAVPPTEQSLPSETDVPGLWDAAYDRLGAENPDLLRRYEEMLSGYLGQGDEPGPDPRRPSVTTISPGHHDGETAYHDALARRAKTTRVMRIWLDGLGKREGAEVGSGERAAPALIIAALRKTVLGASESAPHAAVAWAAMCLAAEALFHPPSEAGMAHSDILYVASRMGWYISLSRLLSAAGNESPSLDGASKPERQHLESTIADLYHSVLSFEIGIAACFPQGSGDHRKHYDRIRELESALATSFGGTQIESLLRQLAKLAQEERDTPREEGKETDEDGDDDEATEQEEVRAMMDGLAAAKPEDTIPSPRDAERQILKPLYDGIIAPKQEYREFLDAAYESERGQLQGRLLWINGAAGSGKTMLMQAIVERLLSQRSEPPKTPCNTSIRPGTLSYFFCNNSERGPEDAVSVLRSLLWQVLDAQPFSKRHLLEKGRSTDRTSFDGPNDFYALSEVFSRIVQDAEFTTTFFAVDAIDDLDEDASGLCDLLGLIVATAKMQPRKVRWLMSTTCGTRGDGLVSDCLVATPGGPLPLGLNLDLQVEGLDTAFNKYMSLKIDELPKLASYEGSFRESITSMLRTNSNVNFLWVSLACQIIEATGTPWTALATLNALPSGARALYKHMRDEIASRRWDSNHCNHVLDTAAVACRPLDIRELRDLRELPREIDVNILVDRICYPFLKVRNNTIYFTHRYAKQVLREHMGQKLSAAHAKMTELCLEKALVGTSSRISTKYAAIYWARHLAKVRDDDGHHGGGAVTGDGDGPGHEAMKAATHFLKRHFLPWVETLASTKLLHQALGELERLERVLRGPPRCDISRQCLDAVREAVLFLRFHESSGIPADTSPQLRLLGVRSAALFWPATGSMKTRLVREACPWISHAFSSEDELDAMVQTLRGHDDWARCCSYSAGGRLVASAADDSTVRVWDAETGSAQRVFPVDDERSPARRVVFSPRRGPLGDSELLAASTSSIIKIWDVITGNLRVELKSPQMRPEGGDNYVGDIGFSPDGKTLAVAIDESLMTVDLETLEATEWPQPGGEKTDESVRRVVYAQKAPLLATSQGRVISLWDCGTRKVLRRLAKHDRAIDGLAFSPDSRFLASGADDETVRVWSVDSGQELRVFSLHTSYVNSVSFSPDGTRVASASHDATVRIWTAQSGWDRGQVGQPPVTTTVLTGHRRAIQWVTFSPSGERIASASNDATVRVWDSNVGRPEMVPEGGGATTGENGGDASGPVRARRRRCHTGAVAVLAFSPPDGKTLASGCEDGMVCLWDGETGGHLQALVANEEGPATFRSRRITSLVFSPSGEMLVSTSADRHARVWDVASGNLKWSLGDHRDWVRGAAVSPDERLVASACDDRCVRLWDLAADSPPESPITLRGHSDYVYSVAFSADNRYLGSAGDDCRVLVWDLATAKGEDSKPDKILDGPGVGPLRSIVFTPDGARLLASSGDGTISLWDVKTGLLVRQGQAGQGAKFGGALALQMDGQHPDDVVTQLGTWPLARLGLGLQDLERPLPPLWSPIGLGEDGCWITWKKRDLVFIPKQCRGRSGRPAATRFQGYKAAVGCESGQVVLLNFKQGVEPVFEDGL